MTRVMQATKRRLYGGDHHRQSAMSGVSRVGGQCRAIWNHWLAINVSRFREKKEFAFYAEMSADLPRLLKEDPRLIGCPHRAAQMTVQRLDRALRDSFKSATNRKGFPKFKRKSDRADSFSFVGREVRVEDNRIRLPRIGWVRVRGLHLPVGADTKQVNITQEPDGWHVSIQFEAEAKTYADPVMPEVGIDGGLLHLATLSDGTKIEHPRLAKKAASRIRRLNRERDRRRKGSVNRRRTVARLARAHRHVANQRKDHVHKATRRLVDTYEGFAVEDLSLRGMMKTRMAGSLADAGLGGFLRTLRYKARWAGRAWRVLPRFQRSTGVCPDCGWVGPKLPLSVREWVCDGCGAVHDRDVAAAKAICLGAVGQALPEPAPKRGRKRGFADQGGDLARAGSSLGGPPANVQQLRRTTCVA